MSAWTQLGQKNPRCVQAEERSEHVKIGVMIFATDQTMPLHRLAPEVEARGFESLWVPEKTHLPTSRRTPWPGGELPEWYKRTSDPFVALAAAGAVTTTLRIGTGVALLSLRDPVIAAKTIATLDWQTAGRLELGVGYGWNTEEFATHGFDLTQSPERLRECVALMRQLWTHDEASFEGRHVAVEPSWSWPKPHNPSGPPVHIGARPNPDVFAEIAAWGTGWLPIEGYGDLLDQIPQLHAAFERANRDPRTARVSVYSSQGQPSDLEAYEAASIDRTICWLPPADEHTVMSYLDELTVRVQPFHRSPTV